MKIVVASRNRSHLMDCARELTGQGHNVVYYCMTRPGNYKKFKYTGKSVNLIYIMFPFFFLSKKWKGGKIQRLCDLILDLIVYIIMPKCDVFIAQSPNYQYSLRRAKKRGAITILDRGSSHVRKFNSINQKFGIPQQVESYQKRDEKMYKEADYITIASDFVKEGFIEYGVNTSKLFVNPYGVSLKNFHSTVCTNEYDCIVVGQWSKRKGHELLVKAFKDTNIRILHVGSITDYPFPTLSNFTHINSVPEYELINYYKKSKVFIFPSYDDGFGLVLLQAAACGMPIVCSKNSGGPTLKSMISNKEYIYEMAELTEKELIKGFNLLNGLYSNNDIRNYAEEDLNKFSWEAYGIRYNNFLNTIVK